MKQHLLVEGHDFYVIGSIWKKLGGKNAVGYNTEKEAKEFIVGGKSKEKTIKEFKAFLKQSDLTHLGIMVDADESVVNTWASIKNILVDKYGKEAMKKYNTMPKEGLVITDLPDDAPKIGIWILPNNTEKGKLEDVVEAMIPKDDDLLPYVKEKVDELVVDKNLCRFSEVDKQKVYIHTWLSWQKETGSTIGTAISTYKYLNPNVEELKPLINWLKNVFEFQSTENNAEKA